MKLTYVATRALSFGPGKLSVEFGYDAIALKCYDGGGPETFRMTYTEGEQVVEIASFAELLHFAKLHNIGVELAVSSNPRGWADLIFAINELANGSRPKLPTLLGIAPVLSDTPMHKEYYAKMGVLYEDVRPGVANDVLTWYAIERKKGEAVLLKYQCNLSNFEVSFCSVRRLSD